MNYGKNWFELSRKCLERDNHTCRRCKTSHPKLAAHHVIPRNKGGKDILENLVSLCPRCHRWQDNQYLRVGRTHYLDRMIEENMSKPEESPLTIQTQNPS